MGKKKIARRNGLAQVTKISVTEAFRLALVGLTLVIAVVSVATCLGG